MTDQQIVGGTEDFFFWSYVITLVAQEIFFFFLCTGHLLKKVELQNHQSMM